jgi:hypothetical protein
MDTKLWAIHDELHSIAATVSEIADGLEEVGVELDSVLVEWQCSRLLAIARSLRYFNTAPRSSCR